MANSEQRTGRLATRHSLLAIRLDLNYAKPGMTIATESLL
jgi:hypothetical protein